MQISPAPENYCLAGWRDPSGDRQIELFKVRGQEEVLDGQ